VINLNQMHMNQRRANDRIDDLLAVHIEALRGDPKSEKVAEALQNAAPDFHNLVDEIFNEIQAIINQERINETAARWAADDGA
jgi:bifunctional DNase/RNase